MIEKRNIAFVICILGMLTASTIYIVLKNESLSTTIQYLVNDIAADHGQKNLMLGSSSIQKLGQTKDLQCGPWLNRGIGSATIPMLNRYLSLSKLSIDPDLVLLYAGENDISSGESATSVIKTYRDFIQRLIKKFPDSDIHIIAIKFSPRRQRFWDGFEIVNSSLSTHVDELKNVFFHSHAMSAREAVLSNFQDDGIHLTKVGYSLFTSGINQVCRTK